MSLNLFATLSPLALVVLFLFLFALAVIVALWSLFALRSAPRSVETLRREPLQPSTNNRFMKRQPEVVDPEPFAELRGELATNSELPANHVSSSRVRMLKTLEPDPELELPQPKETTYGQLVNRQRALKKALPKLNLPKLTLPRPGASKPETPRAPKTGLPKPGLPKTDPTHTEARRVVPAREDTSTQPPLFETSRRKQIVQGDSSQTRPNQTLPNQTLPNQTLSPAPVIKPNPSVKPAGQPPVLPSQYQVRPKATEPRRVAPSQPVSQPSVQRRASEAAYAEQAKQQVPQPKPQEPRQPTKQTPDENEDAFDGFNRKNDDLGF
ncbi:MAG: hypothetical protein ACRCYY_10725 [Trueperaceae bacterium]